jgi:ATP-dependent DNA helicase RecQ
VLLPSDADAGVWDYFATATIPVPEQVNRVLAVLPAPDAEPISVAAAEAQSGVRRGRVELMLKQLAVDGVVDRVEGGWVSTGKAWSYDAEHYDGVVAVRRREADIMRAYTRGERCLMQLLQESLDDPSAEPCGRCSVCRGGVPEDLAGALSAETLAAVTGLLRGQVHMLDPRKMWPGGPFGSRGRIPADLMPEAGRALVFADAPEWRETVARVFGRDAVAPDEVNDASVRMLSQWRATWTARPEVVVDLAAAGFPLLTGSVADHLAGVGRLDRASFESLPTPPADLREMSSAEEAAFWRDNLDPAAIAGAVEGRSVLLVVDATSSLWPVTIAAAALRRAGASAVLPMVLHRRP